jgi:hypothetical protein
MKERQVRCKGCGDRFIVMRFERERTPAYCDLCREERKREQARLRMQRLRARRRPPYNEVADVATTP